MQLSAGLELFKHLFTIRRILAIVAMLIVTVAGMDYAHRVTASTGGADQGVPSVPSEPSEKAADSGKSRSVLERVRPAVTAVNGKAILVVDHDPDVDIIPLHTSLPAFKVFGISDDRSQLLYSPLINGRPSGQLFLEDLSVQQRIKVTEKLILSAAMSPYDPTKIAYTFAGNGGFGLGLVDLNNSSDRVLEESNVFSEFVSWGTDTRIHYFSTSAAEAQVVLNTPSDGTFTGRSGWRNEDGEISLVRRATNERDLVLSAKEATVDGVTSSSGLSGVDFGFPTLDADRRVPVDLLGRGGNDTDPTPGLRSFKLYSPDGKHRVSGEDLIGYDNLILQDLASGTSKSIGKAVLAGVSDGGVIVKEFLPEATVTKYVNWSGRMSTLGLTPVDYRLPLANSTMIQGGGSYPAPGACNLTAHYDTMGYAYDFQRTTVGAHALAIADGLVVFTHSTMACNFIQPSCPDYSSTGCPGFYLGNQVIIQHADGTYSAFSHLQTNSIQVEVGTSACQGLYVGRQGHTGSVSGSFNNCGDHLHVQRQVSPDPSGQSIPVTFSDVAVHPLSCGMGYNTTSTEIAHSISSSTGNFGIAGGSSSVNVTSNGCVWNAVSNDPWITITSPGGGSGSGNGVVTYSVSDNSASGSRVGTMVIGGHLFTVNQAGGGVTNLAPIVNAGTDQTVDISIGASLTGAVSDDSLPSPPAAVASAWSKVTGPGNVTFANANSPVTAANFSLAGIYVLRLTANDGALTSSDDITVVVGVTGAGGSLTGGQVVPTNFAVDLSTEGTSDWAHWGLTDSTSFDHKTGVVQQISNLSRIGTISTIRSSSNGDPTVYYTWNDGTPTGAAVNTPTCIYTYGQGNGFEFTVPADTFQRTLRLYVGVWRIRGRLEAELSDGSASPLIDNSLSTVYPAGAQNGVYTITYSAASAGQTLRLRWYIESTTYPVGNINVQAVTLTGGVAPPVNQAPLVNAGSDKAIMLPGSASLSGAVTDDGLPNPPAAVSTAWTKVSGPGTVTFGNANALSTTADFSAAGTYVLRLTGDDGALSASDDLTVTVNPAGAAGSLSASSAVSPANVNLSAEGTADWAHWGISNASSFNHKNGVTQQISNFTRIGGGATQRYSNNPTFFSWTGGTPTASAANTSTGVYATGQNNGFQMTVPADTTARTLKLYVGLWAAGGRLEASLSDGSAPTYVDTSISNSGGTSNGVYTLNYQAGSAGQTLTVKWTANTTFSQWGNVTIQAATLAMSGPPVNQPPLVDAGTDQAITLPASATLNGTATDDGLPNPPATLTTNWTKVSGPGTVTFGNANALSTTADFSTSGTYVLRLTGDDSVLNASDDMTVIVNLPGIGVLSVSGAAPAPNVDLSGEGTADWAHWGLASPTSFNHKSGVTSQIGNYTLIGNGIAQQFSGNSTSYSWSGGAPTASASGVNTGLWIVGAGNGYQIVVPADTTARTLKMYVGLWAAGGRFEASLSDGSAPIYVDTTQVSSGSSINRVYTINYQAGSAGQTLTVKWTLNTTFNPWSNVTLQAASLGGVPVPLPNQAPLVNAGSDKAIMLPGSASLSGAVTDDGLPNPPAAVSTAWTKVSGPGTVTFGNANALSTTADFSAAGTYVLRLTGDDGALSASDDLTVTVNPAGAAGSLSASSAVSPANVNLSAEGTADWAHWGISNASSFNHKNGVTQQISNFTRIGGGATQRYSNNPTFFSWTGGTPTASAANTSTGVYATGQNNGFQMTVPADTTARTLKLYVGLWAAGGRLEASLSDGSAPTYVDTSISNSGGTSNGVYTLNYQAGSAGQTLTVKWTANTTFSQWGNVTLQAATLANGTIPFSGLNNSPFELWGIDGLGGHKRVTNDPSGEGEFDTLRILRPELSLAIGMGFPYR
ncbi:MAG TPA: peptidoglycan DD-metalloendopeptidase family protein [Pyrinomonadaceae bacterium]|nr:peptidoglycan DD-metalloendopeptidase family protein [Pyrinomonadaceae bacterium]